MQKLLAIAALALVTLPALAGTIATPIPEPSTLGLIAIGAVAGVVVAVRKRNNKK